MDDPTTWVSWLDVKHRRERKRYGVSKMDAWNGDEYVAWIIANTAAHLRKEPYGHPMSLSFFGWQEVLRYIQEGFEAWLTLHKDFPDDAEAALLYEKYKKGMDHFARFHPDMWS